MRRVVMDLSFPPSCSVNNGIPQDTYLGEYYKLRLPGIDRLVEFIIEKGRNCLVFKKDLRRTYRQFLIDPKDYHLLGFRYQGKFILTLTVLLVYVPRQSSANAQQRQLSISSPSRGSLVSDVYLDNCYGAEYPFPCHFGIFSTQPVISSTWFGFCS